MFGKLIEIGSTFDWLSPIGALIGDVVNGPSHTFLIPVDCGYSGREIAKLLSRRGVENWGHMVVKGTVMISVPKRQARWAQHLLDEAGIPTTTDRDEEEKASPDPFAVFDQMEG